jgi:hypothetical protein
VSEDQAAGNAAAVEFDVDAPLDMRIAVSRRSDARAGKIFQHHGGQVIIAEIAHDETAAKIGQQSRKVDLAPLRLDPQPSAMSDSAMHQAGRPAIDATELNGGVRAVRVVPETKRHEVVVKAVGVQHALRHRGDCIAAPVDNPQPEAVFDGQTQPHEFTKVVLHEHI